MMASEDGDGDGPSRLGSGASLLRRASSASKSLQAAVWPRSLSCVPAEERGLSGDSEQSSLSGRWGELVLLDDKKVSIDDQDVAIVIVFPKAIAEGGTIDPLERIEDPIGMCARIFDRGSGRETGEELSREYGSFDDLLGKRSASAGLYHQVVRSKLLWVFERIGLHASTFDSIDGDEVFFKLTLPHDGTVIKHLAQRYQYQMPFQLEKTTRIIESYNNSRSSPRRRFTKERNARDMYGRPVPAYTTFEFDVADDLEPFRQVDEIRLIQLCLTDWLNMSELVQQGVVSKWFPAANYDAVQTLGKHWGNIRKAWSCDAVPNLVTFKVGDGKPLGDEIRDYFGEEVAFFWMWFTHYVRMLVPLALVGTVCALRYVVLAESAQRRVEIGFCIVMLLWATVFCDVFKRKTDRCRQRWGMKDFEAVSADLHGYNEAAEGTWHNEMKRHLAVVGVGAYCLFFMGVVAVAEYNLKEAQRKGAATNGALITVGIIQGGSFVWNRIAPKLADLQNHKTQARWNDALVWILSGPKLFVVLYPFLSVAFLKKFYNRECTEQQSPFIDQHGLANLAWMTYSGNGWPSGIPNRTELESAGGPHDIGDKFDLSWFRPYTYQGDMKQCIWGCYPVDCRHDIEAGSLISENGNWAAFRSEWSCKTNCWMELTGRLTSFWVFQIITHLVFLAVPIVLMRVEVYKELYGKSSRRDRPAEDGAREAYSFLQYQAKCHETASYEYYSWGGSPVEDFLDLARGYALLTCFGIALPSMSLFTLLTHLVEYRLYAFRMAHVTCRPWPQGAEGIGLWSDVFNFLSFLSLTVNIGLAVFVMNPMQMWSLENQLAAFLVLEHALLFLREAIKASIPDEPEDVRRIEAYNSHFINKITKHSDYRIPEGEKFSMQSVDLSICRWR